MDVRARRLEVERRSADTMIELPICLFLIAMLTVVALQGFAQARIRLRSLDAILLSQGPVLAASVYRANTGRWPASNEEAGYPAQPVELPTRLESVRIRAGGAADFVFSGKERALAGRTLSFRAWQASDPATPIVWRCGRSRAPAPLVGAQDQTTVAARDLLSACRMP